MTMISNALHCCIEKQGRRALAEHETVELKNLNEAVLITNRELDRNPVVTEIMENCKSVESRKMKIMSEMKKTKSSKDGNRSSQKIFDPNLPIVQESPSNKAVVSNLNSSEVISVSN